jgi:hypothetical protein
MIVLGEAHLRWILSDYGRNDNDVRTHHLWNKMLRLIALIQRPEAIAHAQSLADQYVRV